MAHRGGNKQLGLADALVHPGIGKNAQLDRINETVEWGAIEQVLSPLRSGARGTPPYAALTMFKALLLQQWYQLSDPGLEQALADRLSFRRFLGLGLDQSTPDHSTLWRFREALRHSGLDQAAFAAVHAQLDRLGLLIKRGTLVDATLVQAHGHPPPGDQPGHDPDAKFTRRGPRSYYGYKAHIAVDQDSGLVRRALLTAANVNDTEMADALICGDEQAYYADAAYDTHARRARLRAMGIADGILHRPNKHHRRLPEHLARRNRALSRIRCRVETIFAIWKRHYGYWRVRYFGLLRNQTQLTLLAIATNLKRMAVLTA
jgi:IS5 family transposase